MKYTLEFSVLELERCVVDSLGHPAGSTSATRRPAPGAAGECKIRERVLTRPAASTVQPLRWPSSPTCDMDITRLRPADVHHENADPKGDGYVMHLDLGWACFGLGRAGPVNTNN
jgi:hypothetical protein